MFVFLKEKMKYPAVCTEDRKHWIIVGCNEETLKEFEQEYGLKRGDEGIYNVYHTDNPEYFRIACASLPHRLSPMFAANQMPYESFFEMHKYFYRDTRGNLAVKGVYFSTGEDENPFKPIPTNNQSEYTCLADVKLNG